VPALNGAAAVLSVYIWNCSDSTAQTSARILMYLLSNNNHSTHIIIRLVGDAYYGSLPAYRSVPSGKSERFVVICCRLWRRTSRDTQRVYRLNALVRRVGEYKSTSYVWLMKFRRWGGGGEGFIRRGKRVISVALHRRQIIWIRATETIRLLDRTPIQWYNVRIII